MASLNIIIFIFFSYIFIPNIMGGYAIEIAVQRIDVTYRNMKHLDFFNLTAKKTKRQSPYVMYVDFQAKYEIGNNISGKAKLYELISGRYVPTMFQYQYRLCDWLNNDKILGQLWKSILPENATCPFPKKSRITLKAEAFTLNLPFHIPFTWSPYIVHTRLDAEVYHTTTKEALLAFSAYPDIKQRPLEKPGPRKDNPYTNITHL